jgi:hypothetical protein
LLSPVQYLNDLSLFNLVCAYYLITFPSNSILHHHPVKTKGVKMTSSSPATPEKSLLEKLLTPGWKPSPATFPELPECIIWMRFVLAICFGIFIGLESKPRGGVNVMFALNLIAFVPVFYATTYLGASQDEFGAKLIFGGVVQGLALTILIWIYFYTGNHPEDLAAFTAVFGNSTEAATTFANVPEDFTTTTSTETEF